MLPTKLSELNKLISWNTKTCKEGNTGCSCRNVKNNLQFKVVFWWIFMVKILWYCAQKNTYTD